MDTFEIGGNKNAFTSVWEQAPFAPRPNGELPGYVITKDAGVYGNMAATGPLTLREAEGALATYRAKDPGYHIARLSR